MNTIEESLEPISGYLYSITRDTVNGWYMLEVGIPDKWVYRENKYIGCEIINENEDGKLIRISPKIDKITLDDLIRFVSIIIDTNNRIAEKEIEFQQQMEIAKKELEKNASKYYEEVDFIKENSFELENKKTESSDSED